MNCLNTAYSSPQTDAKLIQNLKSKLKYIYISLMKFGVNFSFFHFQLGEVSGFFCFFFNADTQAKGQVKNH